jgi:hypothetical protein
MALTLKTPRQRQLIVSSLRKVFATGDIENLTKAAYGFVMLSSGFIAHYSVYGFRGEYQNVDNLKRELVENAPMNQWKNFHPGNRDYDYVMQKRDIYNEILDLIPEDEFPRRRQDFWGQSLRQYA